ncbi:MAG: ATP phosphoribosyltransferase [Cellvibrionaceae bacterium]|jgi:ATP phosphoribosyltransferase
MTRSDIRFAIPSNGRLETDSLAFMDECGLPVKRRNPRQYTATISGLPGVTALWQRQNDIVRGVRQGALDFAIVGLDALKERCPSSKPELCENILILHDKLGISHCELHLAVPSDWNDVNDLEDLKTKAAELKPLRIATKFTNLTEQFMLDHGIAPFETVKADGTLEIAPAIDFADIIVDLVSSGTTLKANSLKQISNGLILHSQGVLIASKQALNERPEVLETARILLEYIAAHLRAKESYTVTANVRGASPEAISAMMLNKAHIRGLQGPTISKVVPHDPAAQAINDWYAINIIVKRKYLATAIRELREIGGSGVIVTEVKYIFEDEPVHYRAMLEALNR